ncbi:MAG: tRNA dihydrouridine(20/20a) synthase DusA [Hyphomicrobiaceae bacterium]
MSTPSHRFCIAPMMELTDRHCRYFHRLLSRRALLYTEMITGEAIRHGNRDRLLAFDPAEHPVALQLGGSDPLVLAQAAAIGEGYGYAEINLNCGCPSTRVQDGRFGACLMREPDLVAGLYSAMQDVVSIPVTVKCRIGVDEQDAEEDLERFVSTLAAAGCRTFIVHARKAWLQGLSPKENREVPPLDYGRVHRLKQRHPTLEIVINGGIGSLQEAASHLEHVDGVMLGRAAYQTPYLLAAVDAALFGDKTSPVSRVDLLRRLLPYTERHVAGGGRLNNITRHILGLLHACPRGRAFRRHLSENAVRDNAGLDVLCGAIAIAEGSMADESATA